MTKRIIPTTFSLSILLFAVNMNTHIIEKKNTKLEMIKIQSKRSILGHSHPYIFYTSDH